MKDQYKVWGMHKNFLVVIGLLVLTSLTACQRMEDASAAGEGVFAVNVVAVKSKKQDLSDKLSLIGTLGANESVQIKNEIDGTIDKINFTEGQFVKKNDLLFEIDMKKTQAAYAQAKANLKLAEATASRYEALVETGAVSRQEYDQTMATLELNRAAIAIVEEELEDARITAPFDGYMGERMVSIGQFISKGTLLSYLISQDPMKAEFHVPERYLGEVNIGQKVQLQVAAYSQEIFEGEVYFIAPQINEQARTVLIKAIVPNQNGRLRRGMFANLSLIVSVNPDAIVIPESALIVKGDTVSVYVVNDASATELKSITTGKRLNGMVEVLTGLGENEVVIIEGYQKIGPGSKVNVKFEEPSAKKSYEII